MHGRDHRPGGHDPIPWPLGLVGGYGSVDLAVTNPGGLMLRYQLGEPSGAALDTSNFVPGTQHNLTHIEDQTATGMGESWAPGNAATRDLLDHASWGSGDDGMVRFNYKQLGA